MDNQRIVAVEWARLKGRRPRKAGSNARLGEHGIAIQVPILRTTTPASDLRVQGYERSDP